VSASIPVADARELRSPWRRTRLIRVVLGLALVALILLTALLASRPTNHSLRFLPRASNGIVVLDLSASISSDTFNRIGETLDQLAATNGRYGLVVFSDVAYEALPPGTPSSALLPYARYFKVPAQTSPGLAPAFPVNPWTNTFSAGTRISAGLGMAFAIIRSEHLARPAVVLISDLDDDPGDVYPSLASSISAFRVERIPLKIVALNPAPNDQALFVRLLGDATQISQAQLPGERTTDSGAPFPRTLALLAVAIALLLAANELYAARLTVEAAA
jgi:hypothetical protein